MQSCFLSSKSRTAGFITPDRSQPLKAPSCNHNASSLSHILYLRCVTSPSVFSAVTLLRTHFTQVRRQQDVTRGNGFKHQAQRCFSVDVSATFTERCQTHHKTASLDKNDDSGTFSIHNHIFNKISNAEMESTEKHSMQSSSNIQFLELL